MKIQLVLCSVNVKLTQNVLPLLILNISQDGCKDFYGVTCAKQL